MLMIISSKQLEKNAFSKIEQVLIPLFPLAEA